MTKLCPNCGAELISDPDLAQGCKKCKECGGTYFIIETTKPLKERNFSKNNNKNLKP
jgi:DNA-directed RNA polymerase subunit M/transcription elongation factor TFIIS